MSQQEYDSMYSKFSAAAENFLERGFPEEQVERWFEEAVDSLDYTFMKE